MPRALPFLTAIALVVASGLVSGLRAQRWRVSEELRASVARLGRVPRNAGAWKGQACAMDQRALDAGEISGYLARRYVNRRSGEAVSVLLVCGLPGPIAVHTPDVCFPGSGQEPIGSPEAQHVRLGSSAPAADFLRADFRKQPSAGPGKVRAFWSWSSTGAWKVPDHPRFAYAAAPALYKLYVLRETAAPEESLKDDPCVDLIRQLLPELEKALFQGPRPR